MAAHVFAVTMPKWGIEMTEGTVTQWNFTVGQEVAKGENLLDVETEKIVNSVESPTSGTLRRVLAPAGETYPVGALIGVFADESVADAAIDAFIADFKGARVSFEPDTHTTSAPDEPPAEETAVASADAGDVRVSPIARRLAQRLGIDVSLVTGTGRNGRVSKEDVEAFAAHSAPASTPPEDSQEPAERIRLSGMRATIARRLLESSQSIPHYRLSVDVDVGKLLEHKSELSASSPARVTLNDFLLRACALSLTRHPKLNAQLVSEEILLFRHADIAVAMATSAGLVAPLVRSADKKSVTEIAAETAALGARAVAGSLTRADLGAGTFTVSNLGMYGVSRFDAIINPPQVAILAVGAAEERVAVKAGVPAVARMLTLTLSSDHRVIDGAMGAAFLATLRELLSAPQGL